MKGQIRQMHTVASELAANQRARSAASKSYGVKSVNKNGSLSKMPLTALEMADTLDKANAIKDRLEELNPGKRFTVVDL